MTTGNVTEWYETEYTHACQKLAQAHTDLAQAHIELRQIRKLWLNPAGAVELRRQLVRMEAGRDFWLKESRALEMDLHHAAEREAAFTEAAETKVEQLRTWLAVQTQRRDEIYASAKEFKKERDEMRQEMQKQSDEVQAHWLSPVEAEGLKRQLAKAQVQSATPKEAAVWLWGFYDGNTLIAKPGYEDDIREAWDKLLIAVDSIAGDALLERLATLDATEAALADCGISGIRHEFNGLADAIQQMVVYIQELEQRAEELEKEPMIEVEITGKEMVEALQSERALRQVAETGERAARKLLSQAIVAQADAELATHVHSKACDELTQTMHTERQLRQEAERQVTATLYHYRDIANQYLQELCIEQRQQREVEQRAERAEALAQLVTLELAALLKRLGCCILPYTFGDPHKLRQCVEDRKDARELAAQIREALDDSQA